MRPDEHIDAVLARHRELWVERLRCYTVVAGIAGLALGVALTVLVLRGPS